MQVALILGHSNFALAKTLTAQIMTTGAQLVPDWDHQGYPIHLLPPLHQVQTWLESCRALERQDDHANMVSRREAVKVLLREDWEQSKSLLFKKLACTNPGPAGYLCEESHRHMITHPEEIHAQLKYHWVNGICQHYREKALLGGFCKRVPRNTWT